MRWGHVRGFTEWACSNSLHKKMSDCASEVGRSWPGILLPLRIGASSRFQPFPCAHHNRLAVGLTENDWEG